MSTFDNFDNIVQESRLPERDTRGYDTYGSYDDEETQQQDQESNGNNIDQLLGLDDIVINNETNIHKNFKKRARNLKDEHLLSIKGLNYIKKNASKKLPKLISNSSNEYKNLTNLLQFYQIWGHDLYPKANFKDFLKMCNTLGSNSSMLRNQRKEWINEEIAKLQQVNNDYLYTNELQRDETQQDANDGFSEGNNEEQDSNTLFVSGDIGDEEIRTTEPQTQGSAPETNDTNTITQASSNKDNQNEFEQDEFDIEALLGSKSQSGKNAGSELENFPNPATQSAATDTTNEAANSIQEQVQDQAQTQEQQYPDEEEFDEYEQNYLEELEAMRQLEQ